MKVKIVTQPSGLLNGAEWPGAGELIDVPEVVAESMAAAGHVEIVKAEPKKAAASKPKVEKRPAATKAVEKR